MTRQDETATDRPFRRAAMAAAKLVAALATLALFAHMSWNMFAPDLFGLPEIRMKQALGLVTFAGIFSLLLRFAFVPRH